MNDADPQTLTYVLSNTLKSWEHTACSISVFVAVSLSASMDKVDVRIFRWSEGRREHSSTVLSETFGRGKRSLNSPCATSKLWPRESKIYRIAYIYEVDS